MLVFTLNILLFQYLITIFCKFFFLKRLFTKFCGIYIFYSISILNRFDSDSHNLLHENRLLNVDSDTLAEKWQNELRLAAATR